MNCDISSVNFLIEALNESLDHLPARERIVIEQRFGLFGETLTLAQIGQGQNRSREAIRRREASGLRRLRKYWKSKPDLRGFFKTWVTTDKTISLEAVPIKLEAWKPRELISGCKITDRKSAVEFIGAKWFRSVLPLYTSGQTVEVEIDPAGIEELRRKFVNAGFMPYDLTTLAKGDVRVQAFYSKDFSTAKVKFTFLVDNFRA